MLGAILGDVVGSRFEFDNIRVKEFELDHPSCKVTDDSVMTIAVMKTLLESDVTNERAYKKALIANFQALYRAYPDGDYGCCFTGWLETDNPAPNNSYGNGACMRVSPCAAVGALIPGNREDVTRWTTEVSHNHPISLAWAEFLASCIQEIGLHNGWHGRYADRVQYRQWSTAESLEYLRKRLAQTKTAVQRDAYYDETTEPEPGVFDETCQGTLPLAIQAVLDADSFTDTIRNAVSYGGDSDTIAAIAGSLAEPLFGIPDAEYRPTVRRIPAPLYRIVRRFYETIQLR